MFDRDEAKPADVSDSFLERTEEAILQRCQVDTPPTIVELVWRLLKERRTKAPTVVDYGCGDGRFAEGGWFRQYRGYEVDARRAPKQSLGAHCEVKIACAFDSAEPQQWKACIGNPPYIRHHDINKGWLKATEAKLSSLLPYEADGRANAFIYFMWLALATVSADGLIALVVPFEWVSRPASEKLRKYVKANDWSVDVYQLDDSIFHGVLTTACITIIDKARKTGEWRIWSIDQQGNATPHKNPTRTSAKRLDYENAGDFARAMRGLSPGGQKAFILTEGERIHFRLRAGVDVLPAVTSFKHVSTDVSKLTSATFRDNFVNAGRACWLINSHSALSNAVKTYLDRVPKALIDNWTCQSRQDWWKYRLPPPAQILYASGFTGSRPKLLLNDIGAIHVGSIHGVYAKSKVLGRYIFEHLAKTSVANRVVPLAGGFTKIEVKQMNTLLNKIVKQYNNRD
jgi:hypothetical protein